MTKPVSVLIVAGETSGDLLGASIIRELKKYKNYSFWGFGGDNMSKEKTEILFHCDKMATIGFWEGIKRYFFFKNLMRKVVNEAAKRKPKAAILIDFSGFNIRLAAALYKLKIPCYKVVSSQIWAWNYKRIYKIKKYFKSVLCLYDFEIDLYEKEKASAFFMGHPLVDSAKASLEKYKIKKNSFRNASQIKKNPNIALLPGSRISEINRHLPFLIELAKSLRKENSRAKFIIPASAESIENKIRNFNPPSYITISNKGTHHTLLWADAAVACSGTVTLECALFETPFLIIYKTSTLTFMIGKKVVKIPYIGMVNMLYKDFLAKEFLQHDMTIKNVLPELKNILFNDNYRKEMRKKLISVQKSLGKGSASKKAASYLNKNIK
ncbi:MAG: lipid-A-disaccharide synthase [Spirochaetia bacterium]|nr:lipid-A-disaccharide synthase [Spirochaetia bacterium]